MRRKVGDGKKHRGEGDMISAGDSSSEATESSGNALATGMMHLAIACTHVQRESQEEAEAAGKFASSIDSLDWRVEF